MLLLSKKLEPLCHLHETIRVKSGAWDGPDAFVYATSTHIKYALVTGDRGLVRAIEAPIYLTHVSNGVAHALDREAKVHLHLHLAFRPHLACICTPAPLASILSAPRIHLASMSRHAACRCSSWRST